jgi:hypothetical protein
MHGRWSQQIVTVDEFNTAFSYKTMHNQTFKLKGHKSLSYAAQPNGDNEIWKSCGQSIG